MQSTEPDPDAPTRPHDPSAVGGTAAALARAPLPAGYTLLEELRCDAHARVVRAQFGDEERLLRLEPGGGAEARAELAVLAALDHPGIAPLLDHGALASGGPLGDGLFVARAWIPGQDLLRWSEGRTSEELGALVLRILPALAHLHERGFVHGDLKPENVLVDATGAPRLVDFGLGRAVGDVDPVAGVSGTLFSLAPEVLAGLEATPASDLFALGVLLHRLFVGHRRSARDFYASFPRRSFLDAIGSSPEELPDWARDLVVTLTAREPARRPRSAAEFARILGTRLGLAVEAEGTTPPLRWPAARGRERWVAEQVTAVGDSETRFTWLRTPAGESPFGLWEHLRLQLTLRGASNRGLRLGSASQALPRKADLEDWATALVHPGGLLVVAAGEGDLDPWSLHAVRLLARACAVRAAELRRGGESVEDGPAPPRLLVLSAAGAPTARAEEADVPWIEVAVPPVRAEDVETFLRSRFEREDPARLQEFGAALLQHAAGSASALDGTLGDLQRAAAILPEGGAFRLRPGELPDLRALRAPRDPRTVLAPGAERELLGLLEALDAPLGFAELAALSRASEPELAASLACLGAGGWIERLRTQGHLRVRPGYRPADPLLSPAEAAVVHARRAEQLAAAGAEGHVVARHRLCAAWLDPEAAPATRERATAALLEELETLRQRGAAELVLAALESATRTLARFGLDADRALPELTCEAASAWCSLGRPDLAEELARALHSDTRGRRDALAELVRARIASLRHQGEAALEHYERAATLDPTLEGEAFVGRVLLAHAMGRDADVLALVEAAREAERAGGGVLASLAPRPRLALLSTAAMSAFRRGEVERARTETQALLAKAAALDDPPTEAALRMNLATIERRSGSLALARAELERAAALYSAAGPARGLAHARELLGGLLREEGDMRSAEELLHESLASRERLGDEVGASNVRASLGLVAYDRGHVRGALETLEAALAAMGAAYRRRFGPLLVAKSRALLARLGRGAASRNDGGEAVREEADPRVLLELGRASWCAGEEQQAADYLRRAAGLAASLGQSRLVAEAELLGDVLAGGVPLLLTPERLAGLGTLAAQDARLLAYLLSGHGDAEPPDDVVTLAAELEASGRDDRAARLLFALASRVEDDAVSEDYRTRAEAAFAAVRAGATPAEAEALRRHLLGFPDPYPGDLAPRTSRRGNDEDMEMEVVNLLEINRRLLQQQDLATLLGAIVESALAVTGAERGFFVLEEHGVLRFDTALDSSRGDVQRPELEVSRSVVAEALERMEPVRVSNAVDDPLLGHTTSVVSLELRSVLCVPVAVDADLRGAIYVDHRLRRGAFDERAERLCTLLASQAALAIQQIRRLDEIRSLNRRLERRVLERESDLESARRALRAAGADEPRGTRLIGSSQAMQAVRDLIRRAAPSDLPVLVTGESGTGKELAARALHEQSNRADGPFVSENCAAIPASLIESELFGFVQGAFTGADRDRAGLFEQAGGGTLFLDEIGEMPLELQAKLLRVLETGEVRRLGANEATTVDFRLVVATNRDLAAEVEAGRFRKDLYYRLDGLRVDLPQLERRTEDVPELVTHFLRVEAAKAGEGPRKISKEVLARLSRRGWPGNVRELRNEVARLCVLCEGDLDDPELVRMPVADVRLDGDEFPTLAELERRAILAALERTGDDKSKAAELLGISRAKVYQRLKEWKDRD